MADEDPRATLAELATQIEQRFARRLLGLYLFGSLPSGDFHAGRSDLDLVAVLDSDVTEGADLDRLREMHERFETERPAWRDRVEVLYLSRAVLATFDGAPTGTVARVSPGEPLHLVDLAGEVSWRLDWHAVLAADHALVGPPPVEVGPQVTPEQFREAVLSQLADLRESARRNHVAYMPAVQGYMAATISRALYSLATGRQTSKAAAIEWAAQRYPEHADYLRSAFAAYRADVHGPHQHLIDFAEQAARHAE